MATDTPSFPQPVLESEADMTLYPATSKPDYVDRLVREEAEATPPDLGSLFSTLMASFMMDNDGNIVAKPNAAQDVGNAVEILFEAYELVKNSKPRWFAVTVGKEVGIIRSPARMILSTKRVRGAFMTKHDSAEEAWDAFQTARREGKVRIHGPQCWQDVGEGWPLHEEDDGTKSTWYLSSDCQHDASVSGV